MQIFKLEPVAVTSSGKTEGKPESQVSPSDTEELKQAQQVAGEAPEKAEVDGQPVVKQADQFTLGELKTEQAPMAVRVEGPLGKVFTETLNKMLALEGIAALPIGEAELEKIREQQGKVVNVEVLPGEELGMSDVVSVMNKSTGHPGEPYVIALEAIREGKVPDAVEYLYGLEKLGQVKVHHRVGLAVDAVVEVVKREWSC